MTAEHNTFLASRVGKMPTGFPTALSSSNHIVIRSKSDGELFMTSGQGDCGNISGFCTPPLQNVSQNSKAVGFRQVATVLTVGFSQDQVMPAPTILEVSWKSLSWTHQVELLQSHPTIAHLPLPVSLAIINGLIIW
jgi:hypothetical protein